MMRIARLTLVPLLVLLLLACGGSDDEKPANTPASSQSAAPAPWPALLSSIRNIADNRKYIVMNDYESMRRAANLEAPKDPATVADYRKQLLSSPGGITAMPSHISGLGQYFDANLWNAQLGFHPGQVDADIQAGPPPDDAQVLRGRFDANAIDTAINKDGAPLRNMLSQLSRDGARVYIWGDDFAVNVQNRSVLRPLGRGERLAVKDNLLFWTHQSPQMLDMIEGAAGKKPTMADDDDIKAILAGLSKHSLTTVIISGETLTPELLDVVNRDPSAVKEARDASFKEALKPFHMVAIGYGQDAQGPFNLLILLHATDARAKENVAKLQAKIDTGKSAQGGTAWKELITASDITTEGKLLIARLRTQRPALLTQVFLQRDSLLVHE